MNRALKLGLGAVLGGALIAGAEGCGNAGRVISGVGRATGRGLFGITGNLISAAEHLAADDFNDEGTRNKPLDCAMESVRRELPYGAVAFVGIDFNGAREDRHLIFEMNGEGFYDRKEMVIPKGKTFAYVSYERKIPKKIDYSFSEGGRVLIKRSAGEPFTTLPCTRVAGFDLTQPDNFGP